MNKKTVAKKEKAVTTNATTRSGGKYSDKIQDILFRQTKSEKRKSVFGNDPMAG